MGRFASAPCRLVTCLCLLAVSAGLAAAQQIVPPNRPVSTCFPGVLDAWPVGPDVGNVRNNGAHLVEPVDLAP